MVCFARKFFGEISLACGFARSVFLCVLLMGFSFTELGFAQSKRSSENNVLRLEWNSITQRALGQNLDLNAAQQELRAADASKKAAYAGYLPTISATASQSETVNEVRNVTTDAVSKRYGFSASLNVFNGFATTAQVSKSEAQKQSARAALKAKSVDVRYTLRQAQINAMIATRQIKLSSSLLERRKANLSFIRLKYESGAEAKWSVLQAEADFENAKATLAADQVTLDNALSEIRRLLDLPQVQKIEVTDEIENLLSQMTKLPKKKLEENPSWQQLDSQLQASIEDVRLARSEFLPSVGVSYSWNRNKIDENDPINESVTSVSLSIPLFSGLSTYHTVQKANANRYRNEATRAATRAEIETEFERATRAIENAKRQIPVADQSLRASQSRVSTVTTQYRMGLKRYIEWEDAQTRLVDAERKTLVVRRDALLALSDFEKAAGFGLGEVW